MRKTMARLFGGLVTTCLAGSLATIAIVATTDSVSLQDIVDMTGTRTAVENRWLAHVVSVPNGSVHEMIPENGEGFTTQHTTRLMAVQTAEALHVFDRDKDQKSGDRPTINRGLKGDRVVEQPAIVAKVIHPHALIATDSLITASLSPSQTNPLLKTALSFRQSMPSVAEETDPQRNDLKTAVAANLADAQGRIGIAEGQLTQARAAARLMASVLEKTRKVETNSSGDIDHANVVSAYAPAVSEQVSEMASAFAAVIRPSGPEANGNHVVLGKGDHEWAANPLPRDSFSKKQRSCLATGVYFEARGESLKGQKAVAQVILNRVKNPAYPDSICGVVYQNKWMYNSCQFSFACDGIRDRVNSPHHWKIATDVANDAIDGRFWLASVGSASHYHADYVWPKWRRSMKKMVKIGRHIFYRTYGGGWS